VDVQPQYVFASFPDGPEFLGNLYGSAAPAARLGPHMEGSEALDQLLVTARRSLDEGLRTRLMTQADSILAEETPDILLWQVPLTSARRTAVHTCSVGLFTDPYEPSSSGDP
jgi:ABC-type transport system substrate-binding protein